MHLCLRECQQFCCLHVSWVRLAEQTHSCRIPPEVTPEAAHGLWHGREPVQCVPDEDLGVVYTELKAESIQQGPLSRQDRLPQRVSNLWVLQALQRFGAVVVPVADDTLLSMAPTQLSSVTWYLL